MSRMTHSKCGECRNYFKCDSACKNDWACEDFEPQGKSLFERITASPEVLAPCFVEKQPDQWDDDAYAYYSYLTKEWYATEDKAIAATVAKLKEAVE